MIHPSIEVLESRIAPATLISATTASYIDADGDLVTVKFSKPILTGPNLNTILNFAQDVVGNSLPHEQLRSIELSGLDDALIKGLSITVTAKAQPLEGDGLAHVGFINAEGHDLGTVTIDGDLGRILAGDNEMTTPGLKALNVHSMGEYGTTTQSSGGSLASLIRGAVGTVTVKGNLRGVDFTVDGFTPEEQQFQDIGTVTIGGSLIGTDAAAGGQIVAFGSIGKVVIGGDLRGGSAEHAGYLHAEDSIGSVTIGGSVLGGAGSYSGLIQANAIGPVKIGFDLRGGTNDESQIAGAISATTSLASLTLGGSLYGGKNTNLYQNLYGQVQAQTMGAVSIKGDVVGSSGYYSGTIYALSKSGQIASLTVGGSVFGGVGEGTGGLYTEGKMGALKIGGDVIGGAGFASAEIYAAQFAPITIGGSLIGGAGEFTGQIYLVNNNQLAATAGAIKIGGDIIGSPEAAANVLQGGNIYGVGDFSSITVGGSLVGGERIYTGNIYTLGAFGSVKVGGNLYGGSRDLAGGNGATGSVGSIEVAGSIIAGSSAFSAIFSEVQLGTLAIGGDVQGSNDARVIIQALGLNPQNLAFGSIKVGGSTTYLNVRAGLSFDNGFNANAVINSVSVGGDWLSSNLLSGVEDTLGAPHGDGSDVLLDDTNAAALSRIGSVTIGGMALGAAGQHFGIVAQQIGALKVGPVKYALTTGTEVRELAEFGSAGGLGLGGAQGWVTAREDIGNPVITTNPPADTVLKIVSPTVATYTDESGDLVTIKASKPILEANQFVTIPSGLGLHLTALDLSDVSNANGVDITITAQQQDRNNDGVKEGNGYTWVEQIDATGLDLGKVTVAGDISKIIAGDGQYATPAVKALTVQSIGEFGFDASTLVGGVGALVVKGNLRGYIVAVADNDDAYGTFGSVSIGGSVIGGAEDHSGALRAATSFGKVSIGGSIFGGSGADSGQLLANAGSMGDLTLGGSLLGGSNSKAGRIGVAEDIGAIKVGHDVVGGTNGGPQGKQAGVIRADGNIKSLSLGGSLRGGSSTVFDPLNGIFETQLMAGGSLGATIVAGGIYGGSGAGGGTLFSAETMKSLTVGGSVIGGSGTVTGAVSASEGFGSVKVGHNLLAGLASNTGIITTDTFGSTGSVAIGGSIHGGAALNSGYLAIRGPVGSFTLGGSLVSGQNTDLAVTSGIVLLGAAKTAKIGGSLVAIEAGAPLFSVSATLGKLSIGANIDFHLGGQTAGGISAEVLGSATVAGSIYGKNGGQQAAFSVNQGIGTLKVGGSIVGGVGGKIALNVATSALPAGATKSGLGSLTVGKNVENAVIVVGGTVNPDVQVGAVKVGGDWIASTLAAGLSGTPKADGTDTAVGGGAATVYAKIASITIAGSVRGLTDSNMDRTGFLAEEIAKVQIGGVKRPLTAGPNNDHMILLGITGDVVIDEVDLSSNA